MIEIHAPIVFVDTETTHLDPEKARPWEIALIRREPGGAESSIVLMVAGIGIDDADPDALEVGRFLDRYRPGAPAIWAHPELAAELVDEWTKPGEHGPVHLVGSNPDYDAQVLSRFLRAHGREPRWYHHVLDLWTLQVGADALDEHARVSLPEKPYELAQRRGVQPPAEHERHTALGDAQWARRWWDALFGGAV